jgi:hypothetical protein
VRHLWKGCAHLLSQLLDYQERERTAVPPRQMHFGALWLDIPVLFALGILLFRSKHVVHFLDAAGTGLLWLTSVLVVSVFVLGGIVYQRRVTIKRQIVVDLIAWAVVVWMYFYFRPWEVPSAR